MLIHLLGNVILYADPSKLYYTLSLIDSRDMHGAVTLPRPLADLSRKTAEQQLKTRNATHYDKCGQSKRGLHPTPVCDEMIAAAPL